MEIIHHFGINSIRYPRIIETLNSLRVKHKDLPLPDLGKFGKGGTLVIFDVKESDYQWREINLLHQQYEFSDMVYTTFTDNEIIAAEWSRLIPTKEVGYPQPESTWVSDKSKFYKDFCMECGTYTQKQPYHIKSEPKMKNYHFFDLIWGYNLFTNTHIIKLLEKHQITGYDPNNIIIHKTKTPSTIIKQLYIYNQTKSGLLHLTDYVSKTCKTCGTTKYQFLKRGYMYYKKAALNPQLDIQLTFEWFGDGHVAFHEFIVSNKLAKLIIDNKLKGVQLRPIEVE